ncbi:MAG TPA: hypothetical protein VJR94_08350 [Candidatus Nitrosocosmicus sp.]|nr:hypothetical protein [Candidatus Nitrosocosmicus sp.]
MPRSIILERLPDSYNVSILGFCLLISLLLVSLYYNGNTVSAVSSPRFDLQEIINENHTWYQTYGNSDDHLMNTYSDILNINYFSDGKILNTTFWLGSGFNSSYYSNQLYRNISYGILIDADSNPRTGYKGANYDFYVEFTNKKLSTYLYKLSSTGGYRLIESNNFTDRFGDPDGFLDSINLNLDLSSINYPSEYNLLFYSAESLDGNEVRQFTSWVNVPPPVLQLATNPSNISIREGDSLTFPGRIKSTTGYSYDVINITASNDDNEGHQFAPGYNSSELNVNIIRDNPPLFRIDIPMGTPLGIYSIPMLATIRETSDAVITKPISLESSGGKIDQEFEISKDYPTEGYLTKPIKLTVNVIAPMTLSDHFMEFWGVYGSFISIVFGGSIGALATIFYDKRKKRSAN